MPNSNVMSFKVLDGELCIHDVVNGHVEYLEALLDLYRELFPQYLAALPGVRDRAFLPADIDPRFVRHQWVVTWNGNPAGLTSFKFAKRQRLGICFSIAVRPKYRPLAWENYARLSDFLIRQMIAQLAVDATTGGLLPPCGLVVEIEVPDSTTDPVAKKTRLHLRDRYLEYGFSPLPVIYHEPAFVRYNADNQSCSELSENAEPMQLCMLSFETGKGMYSSQNGMLNAVIDALLVSHYGLSEDHWIVRQTRHSIKKTG